MKVSIIGGSGRLGLYYAVQLRAVGASVTITGRDQSKLERAACSAEVDFATENVMAIRDADVVILSTPIGATPALILEAARHAKSGALLCDLTSVKSAVLTSYRKVDRSDLELASLHPLHGPRVTDMKDVTILGVFLREGPITTWLRTALQSRGATITSIDGQQHDKAMAVLQGLTHFVAISAAKAIALAGCPPFETPAFTLLRMVMARVTLQDSALYAAIQVENPENAAIRSMFLNVATELDRLGASGDVAAIQRVIEMGALLFEEPDVVRTDACLSALANNVDT